jgi:hypothetical protein
LENDREEKDILMNIERLLRALLKAALAERVRSIHDDRVLRVVYKMTGTNATIAEISKAAKVSTGKISGIWQTWEQEGLITKEGKSYQKLAEQP